jgi:hypothetical protein
MNTNNNEALKSKINELIDSFQNLKDYCVLNNLPTPRIEKCDSLLNQAKEIKDKTEEDISSKIDSLFLALENLKKDFLK